MWFSCLTACKFQRSLKSNKGIESERTVLNLLCTSARYKNDNCDPCRGARKIAHKVACKDACRGTRKGARKVARKVACKVARRGACKGACRGALKGCS